MQGFNDRPIETGEVKGLRVHVVGQEVRKAEKNDEFPGFGEFKVFGDVTRGRVGGLAKGEVV